MHYAINGTFRDLITGCQRSRWHTTLGKFSNMKHLLLSQFGTVVLFPFRKCFWMKMDPSIQSSGVPSFAHTVLTILLECSWPNMPWACTRCPITLMARVLISGKWFGMPYFPDNTGYAQHNIFFVGIRCRNNPIAILIRAFCPWPTAILALHAMLADINAFPQTFKQLEFWLNTAGKTALRVIRNPARAADTILTIFVAVVRTKFVNGLRYLTGYTGLYGNLLRGCMDLQWSKCGGGPQTVGGLG